ncbi:uncharacterized protein CMU_023860 [Cryptosporidium muris RN66]|uniref:Uncharacterized protein n=1 Tax=Cryptosporidium muris (strain RN66) TaxID=441375 RepID=B6AC28_CRYMR|nr:uncharacterized protein CMU_023860 [Cryptosporidium muris RN66]EEA05381.1 hypothetical protein CMU_023860 [Cryptosporidium muris RN66]|eukprot:XP_002139730.1 hypothetical protein [Cryptosporidium muris RN66]
MESIQDHVNNYPVNIVQGKIFDGMKTSSSIETCVTSTSTQDIPLNQSGEINFENTINSTCVVSVTKDSIVDAITTVTKEIKIRSRLYYTERSLLVGTIGTSIKSLGVAFSIINGNYWYGLYFLYFFSIIPTMFFATRHNSANYLYIAISQIFLLFALATWIRNLIILSIKVRHNQFNLESKSIFLVLDITITLGLMIGLVTNIINILKIRKIFKKLNSQYLDLCIGHRLISSWICFGKKECIVSIPICSN